jgi:hypothetical protein
VEKSEVCKLRRNDDDDDDDDDVFSFEKNS